MKKIRGSASRVSEGKYITREFEFRIYYDRIDKDYCISNGELGCSKAYKTAQEAFKELLSDHGWDWNDFQID